MGLKLPPFSEDDRKTTAELILAEIKDTKQTIKDLDTKIDEYREELNKDRVKYAELYQWVSSIDRELSSVRDRCKDLEDDLKTCETSRLDDFKTKVGWIFAIFIGSVAILLEIVRH